MQNSTTLLREDKELIAQAIIEKAKRHFEDYCVLINDGMKPQRHHRILIDKLEAVERGEIKRLMVFMPPGHAKSTYSSVLFPGWYIGKNPKNTIVSASYSAKLAERFGRKVRDQVSSKIYPFQNVGLSENTKSKGEWETNLGGEYFAAGVGGGITGRRADIGLIDDPIKGREDADSETIRDKTWEWYLSDFRSRLKPDGAIIFILTRWHEDDPIGRILPEDFDFQSGKIRARDGELWEVISLPALAEENDYLGRKPGEALWPSFYSKELLEQERIVQGERNWSALYQQRPSPESGFYFKRDWLRFYDEEPKHLRKYGASDYAVTYEAGDFTCHGVGGVDPMDNLYILDWYREQTTTDVWIEQLIDFIRAHKPVEWAEESGQIVKSVGPFIEKRQREENAYCYRVQYPSASDKATRAQAFRGRMAQGKVYLPSPNSPNYGPWVEKLISELMAFPAGKNDDQIDVLSLFGRMLAKMRKGEAPERKPRDTIVPFTEKWMNMGERIPRSHLRGRG